MVDLRELIQKVSQVKDKSELQILKTQFLGKNSQINMEKEMMELRLEYERELMQMQLEHEAELFRIRISGEEDLFEAQKNLQSQP